MKKRSPKVLIVDADSNLRGIIRDLLAGYGISPIEAPDGFNAIHAFECESPDAVLLSLKMPFMDGMETMRRLKKIDARVPVIILTGYGNIPVAVRAMKFGAYDFITKPPDFERLISVLENAFSDQRPQDKPTETSPKARAEILTGRENEILYWTAKGWNTKDIAEQLAISSRTVEVHRYNLMRKLGLRNKAELIRYAISNGIVPD